MTNARSPYDGKPYYCAFCGVGINGYYACYYACEDLRCLMESAEAAQARREKHEAEKAGNHAHD